MTLHEYRLALTTLTPGQWATFAAWADAVESVDGNLEAFARAPDRERYERMAVFQLRVAGVTGLLTEGEKALAMAADSAYAARQAAIVAERAALSAWWSISAALLTLMVTVALQRRR
jgi:hypothetical protein